MHTSSSVGIQHKPYAATRFCINLLIVFAFLTCYVDRRAQKFYFWPTSPAGNWKISSTPPSTTCTVTKPSLSYHGGCYTISPFERWDSSLPSLDLGSTNTPYSGFHDLFILPHVNLQSERVNRSLFSDNSILDIVSERRGKIVRYLTLSRHI